MKALVYERPGCEYGKNCKAPYSVCEDDEVVINVMSACINKGVERFHNTSQCTKQLVRLHSNEE